MEYALHTSHFTKPKMFKYLLRCRLEKTTTHFGSPQTYSRCSIISRIRATQPRNVSKLDTNQTNVSLKSTWIFESCNVLVPSKEELDTLQEIILRRVLIIFIMRCNIDVGFSLMTACLIGYL